MVEWTEMDGVLRTRSGERSAVIRTTTEGFSVRVGRPGLVLNMNCSDLATAKEIAERFLRCDVGSRRGPEGARSTAPI